MFTIMAAKVVNSPEPVKPLVAQEKQVVNGSLVVEQGTVKEGETRGFVIDCPSCGREPIQSIQSRNMRGELA
jgi:hypothetical protein